MENCGGRPGRALLLNAVERRGLEILTVQRPWRIFSARTPTSATP